jgi:hypothetical protein
VSSGSTSLESKARQPITLSSTPLIAGLLSRSSMEEALSKGIRRAADSCLDRLIFGAKASLHCSAQRRASESDGLSCPRAKYVVESRVLRHPMIVLPFIPAIISMHLGPLCGIRAATRANLLRGIYLRHASSTSDSTPPLSSKARRSVFDGQRKLTLEHFVLRSKSIKLYRDFLRASRNIPNPDARRETVTWLRDEHFEGPSGLKAEFELVGSQRKDKGGKNRS